MTELLFGPELSGGNIEVLVLTERPYGGILLYRSSFGFLFFNHLVPFLIWSCKLTIQVSGINSYNRYTISSFSMRYIKMAVQSLHALSSGPAPIDILDIWHYRFWCRILGY